MTIVIIIFTSVGWLVTFVILCIKAYSKGIDTGANMLSRHLKQRAQEQRNAMLSEMDGVDEGNGEIRRISHGELVQMEAESKDKIRKKRRIGTMSEWTDNFIRKVAEMREAQKQAAVSKDDATAAKCRKLEEQVDDLIIISRMPSDIPADN